MGSTLACFVWSACGTKTIQSRICLKSFFFSLSHLEVVYLNHKLVTTRQWLSVFGLSVKTGPAISCEHWQQVPFSLSFLSFLSLPPHHSQLAFQPCVCELCVCWCCCPDRGSEQAFGWPFYKYCDMVESFCLIVVQSCWAFFSSIKTWTCGKFMTFSLHKPQTFFFVESDLSTYHFQAASQFSHTLFIQWGQPLEVKVCLQILGPGTDAFLSLSFVTVVFCK